MLAVGAVAALALPLATTTAAQAACTTYYVSPTGSDSNTGCSTTTPWKTLAKLNGTTFAAGNQILFQKGGSWSGQLTPQGSGASGNPIVISSYGTGAAPLLAGGGVSATVYLHNQHDWTIQNLEITNTATGNAARAGFLADNDTAGTLHGIHLVNNLIDKVSGYWQNGDPQPSRTSAISFDQTDNNATAAWDDVLISGNTLKDDDAGGIYIGSAIGLNHNINSTNIVIQNNTITNAGGNSIVCVFCSAPLIQSNVVTDSGYRFSGAAIWGGWTNNAVLQYNEVARNWRALYDGEAFDIDNNNTNWTLQYNYTHDNPWGSLEFCCSSTFGALGTTTIRYNISQNDGASNAVWATLQGIASGGTANFYNNTVYMAPGDNGDVTNGTPPGNVNFTNNLIVKHGTGGYQTTNTTWSHNLFYGQHPASEPTDSAKITADPLLLNPGGAAEGRSSASVYQLRTGSPAIGAGAVISGNGGADYFGNAVSATAAPNIGAYNGAGVSALTPTAGAYWRFDESTGTTANDTSGHANPATLQAGASWTTSAQMGAGAVSLNGTSTGYVDASAPVVDTSASYTIGAWVKPSSLTGNQTYVSIDGTTVSPFYLQLEGGKYVFTVRSADSTSSTYAQVFGPSATVGTWAHVMGEYDATAHVIKLYVNGVLQGSTAWSSGWKATGHTKIGQAKWNGAPVDFANAVVDDVHAIPGTVTDREAFALGTGATAYFELDEGAGSTFNDVTSGVPTGHLESGAAWAGSGKIGSNALSFPGRPGAYAETPVSAVDTSKSFAVGAWVNLNSTAGNQTFASMSGFNISPFYLQLSGGKFAFTMRSADDTNSTATSVSATSTASTSTWYHVLGMYDQGAGTISLYVNGVLQGSTSYTTPWKSIGATVLGGAEWALSPVDPVNGTIDDVHFYNKVLNASQISTLAAP